MRYSPTRRFIAYTAGTGSHPADPRVTIRDLATGEELIVGAGGKARWIGSDAIVYNSQAGELTLAEWPAWTRFVIGVGGDTVAAADGKWAVGRGRMIVTSWGEAISEAGSPVLSRNGEWLAYVAFDTPEAHTNTLRLRRAEIGAPVRDLRIGPIARPRFSHVGTTLCWEEAGRIVGIFDVANDQVPDVDLTPPGWEGFCSQPVPIWTGRDGYTAMVLDLGAEGQLAVAGWQRADGWILGRSSGSGFEWDACAASEGVLLDAHLSPQGMYRGGTLHLAVPRVSLVKPKDPPPPADEPFEADPHGVIEDTLPLIVGRAPKLVRPNMACFIKSPTRASYCEYWSWDDTWGYHEWDATRDPEGDRGWWLVDPSYRLATPKARMFPRRIRGRVEWNFIGEKHSFGSPSFPIPAGVVEEVSRYEHRGYAEVAKRGTVNGQRISFVFVIDNRVERAPNGRLKGNYEKYIYGNEHILRWESWKTNSDNTADVRVHFQDIQPGASSPLDPLPCPRPPDPPPPQPTKEDPLIRYEELVNFEGRLQDTYQNHGHHPERLVPTNVDAEGEVWRRTYFDLRRGLAHEAATRRIESQIDIIEGRPDRWASPPPVTPPGVVLPLRAEGTTFRLPDGRIYKYRGLTAFTALQDYLKGRERKLLAYVDWARTVTHEPTLRVFGMWSITGFDPRRYGAEYYDGLHDFVRWLGAHGCRLHYVAFTDQVAGSPVRMSDVEQDAHLIQSGAALDGEPNVFYEAVNEDAQNGRLAARFPHGWFRGMLATRSSWPDGETPASVGSVLSFTSEHTPRDAESERKAKNLLETSRQGLGGFPPTGKPAIGGEPPRLESWSPRQAADYFAVAELMAAGACIHGGRDTLQQCHAPTAHEQQCIEAIQAIWQDGVIPGDAQLGAYTRGGPDPPLPCPLVHDDARALRTFAMLLGPRGTCVIVRGTDEPRGDHGWRVVDRAGSHGQVVYVAR